MNADSGQFSKQFCDSDDRRHRDMGPPPDVEERRTDIRDRNELKKIIEERKVAEAINRARLESMAVKNAKTQRLLSWIAMIMSAFAIALPQYNISRDADTAKDILNSLGTSGEQLRKDLTLAQDKHGVYEAQLVETKTAISKIINDMELRHLKIDGSFSAIETKITDALQNIKELQINVNKLSTELVRQETLISVLREQLKIKRTDYAGAPQ